MIPLKDSTPSRTFPFVNWSLIIINVFVFFNEIHLNQFELSIFLNRYAIIPAKIFYEIFTPGQFSLSTLTPFLTSMFLHGGIGHIIGNMWFLYIFGDNVEDKMGHLRYLIFYLLSGIIASVVHCLLYANSTIPALGASGAISGVMAAYMFLFPGSKIITFVPIIFILPLLIEVPAFIFIGLWFIGQLLSGTITLFNGMATGIAFWAHIGGFLGGLFIYKYFLKKRKIIYII